MPRKPFGEPFETFVDRQIREARDAGAFDDLPGQGQPFSDLDAPHDDMWWVKKLMAREQLSVLPAALELRRDVERALIAALSRGREVDVRRDVAAINGRIGHLNARATSGPPSDIAPLDPETVVERWRQRSEHNR